MSRRKRLGPGEVHCGECYEPMLEAAAVTMNGVYLHPIDCFAPALKKWRAALDKAVQENVGAFDLNVSMRSASPEVAYRLGRLTADVLRSRRAAR